MRKVRSFGSWLLAGLGIGVAVRALVASRRPEESELPGKPVPVDGGDTEPEPMTAPLAAVDPRSAPLDQPADRLQTWVAIARLVLQRLKAHTTTVVAGSLAYYALLAVFPSIIAAISIYGRVADPTT